MTSVSHFFSLSLPFYLFLFVFNFGCSEFGSGYNGSGLMGFGTGHIPPKPNLTLTLTATPDAFVTENPANQAKLTLRKDLFSDENGDILFYALLVGIVHHSEPPTNGTWNITYWPNIPNFNWENTSYQVTPAFWNPFGNSSEISYTLGDGTCDNDKNYCNNPLRENTKYTLKIRAFTDSGYQDTDIICFQTLENLPVSKIVSILGGLLLITAVAVCVSIFNFASSSAGFEHSNFGSIYYSNHHTNLCSNQYNDLRSTTPPPHSQPDEGSSTSSRNVAPLYSNGYSPAHNFSSSSNISRSSGYSPVNIQYNK